MSVELPFRDALLDPEIAIPQGLSDGLGQPAGRRYNVYRNNITASLTDALETGFPAIQKLLGAENFSGLARMYLRASPPKSARMMLYGADFASFLEGFEPLQKFPYLGDVARLEFLMRESYHAADHTTLDPSALAVDPEALLEMRLKPAPSLRLIASPWPIFGLWAFNMADGPKPQAQAEQVAILRSEFDPTPYTVSSGAFACLSAMQKGEKLGDAYETGLDADEDFDLSEVLTLLITHTALEGPKP